MPETIAQRFGCEGCGKTFAWKPELSKKRVKCKCGATMRVPDLTPPPEPVADYSADLADGPPALPGDDIFDLIDTAPARAPAFDHARAVAIAMPAVAHAPGSAAALRGSAVALRGSAAALRGGPQVLGYRQGPTKRDRDRRDLGNIHDLKNDVYLPAGLIAGAFLAYFAWLLIRGNVNGGGSLAIYGGVMAVTLILKTVLMIGGAFIIAPLTGVSFGPFWTAVLKLAAVSIAPDVFATIVEQAIGVPGAGLIAGSLALAFYWILMSVLFDMDANEAWVVVVLFGVLRWILTFVLGMVVIALVMSGTGAGGGIAAAAGGGAGAAAVSADADAIAFDESVAAMKEENLLEEADAYMTRTMRQSAQKAMVDALHAAGARNVWFSVSRDINGKTEPDSLVGEWPRDAAKRAALVAAVAKVQAADVKIREQNAKERAGDSRYAPVFTSAPDPLVDDGGKYFELGIGQ